MVLIDSSLERLACLDRPDEEKHVQIPHLRHLAQHAIRFAEHNVMWGSDV